MERHIKRYRRTQEGTYGGIYVTMMVQPETSTVKSSLANRADR